MQERSHKQNIDFIGVHYLYLLPDKDIAEICDRNTVQQRMVGILWKEYLKSVKDFFDMVRKGDFKKSILVVDDDPNYLGLVREWLKDSYKVFMANSGLQAIKWLGKNSVDLILLDHEMPVTSGPQVLEMLRSDEETKSIPVMFLTGKSDKESVMAVVSLKPEGYFLKNIQREELLEKLNEFFILHK